VQNYGFTSVPVKQSEEDKGQKQTGQSQQGGGGNGGGAGTPGKQGKQPKGDAAEPIIMYLNGSRSHPVALAVDDRRHRMMNMKAGDVAFYDHQQQQLHFNKDGAFLTGNTDKKVRMRLAGAGKPGEPKKKEGEQEATEQKKKKFGQQPRYDMSSTKFVDIDKTYSKVSNDRVFLMQPDGNGYVDVTEKKVWLGMEKGKAKHARVLTEDGISDNVYARLGAGPLPFPTSGGGRGSSASISSEEGAILPRKKCFFAFTSDLEALAARVEMIEARLAALEKNHPILFWFLRRGINA
jgi:hypothetical protein